MSALSPNCSRTREMNIWSARERKPLFKVEMHMLQPASYLAGMERKAGLKLVWLKLAYSVGTRVPPRPWAAKSWAVW